MPAQRTRGDTRHGTRGGGGAWSAVKKASGSRRKTLRELGVQRVPSARELFWRDLRLHLRVFQKRRVGRKQGFWDLPTLHARWRALPQVEQATWIARAEALKKSRTKELQSRRTSAAQTPAPAPCTAAADAASPPGQDHLCVSGRPSATTTWLRLDCCAESPGQSPEAAEAGPPVDHAPDALEWAERAGAGRRSLRRVPGAGARLGAGAYGACHVFEDVDTGERWCAKVQRKPSDRDQEMSLQQELKISQACNHTNVMRAYAVLPAGGTGQHALLMACCQCDLHAWLTRRLAFAVAEEPGTPLQGASSAVLVQTCRGLAHLHGVGYLHLDVKPENVLVQPAEGQASIRVLVADFGMAECWEPRQGEPPSYVDARAVQSPGYRPWDLFHASTGTVALQPRLDVWAFGCLVFDVCYEHPQLGGDPAKRPRLYSNISMSASWELVMTRRNYRLRKYLRTRGAALVARCQNLQDSGFLHARMEDYLVGCRELQAA